MPDDMMLSPDGHSLKRGRRGAERHPIQRACEICRVGDEQHPVVAVTRDISTTGVGLQTRHEFQVGDMVIVDIKRSVRIHDATFIYLRGRVVRTQQVAEGVWVVGVHIQETLHKRLKM